MMEIHPTAIIHESVKYNPEKVSIGAYSVIGGIGFGFDPESKFVNRWQHIGIVELEDGVEIGSGCYVDRAVLGTTRIGKNTKLDNKVHVAHNCNIGKNNLFCAGATFGGSVRTGDNVFVGLNATIRDHVTIGDKAFICMGALVTKDVKAGEKVR